jgi:hypothetical protein
MSVVSLRAAKPYIVLGTDKGIDRALDHYCVVMVLTLNTIPLPFS